MDNTAAAQKKPKTYYINECANGGIYVSRRPMNQNYYSTPAILKCITTIAKKLTKKNVFPGAICVTVDNKILKIVSVAFRDGYERQYITPGNLTTPAKK